MCKNYFDMKNTCAYCLRKAGEEIEKVFPVYDWETDQLIGYFCMKHYIKVKRRNIIQKEKIS